MKYLWAQLQNLIVIKYAALWTSVKQWLIKLLAMTHIYIHFHNQILHCFSIQVSLLSWCTFNISAILLFTLILQNSFHHIGMSSNKKRIQSPLYINLMNYIREKKSKRHIMWIEFAEQCTFVEVNKYYKCFFCLKRQ